MTYRYSDEKKIQNQEMMIMWETRQLVCCFDELCKRAGKEEV
jgi:hypothetical protein